MKTIARLFWLPVILSFFSIGAAHAAGTTLSNQMPAALVKQIVEENLWENSFEEPEHRYAADLTWFWNELQAGSTAVDLVVDQMFGAASATTENTPYLRLPRLYPVKVVILRYLEKNKSTPRIQGISQAWRARYIDMALSAISLANIPELQSIANAFKIKMRNREIQIADLSPFERLRLQQASLNSHGVNLLARNKETQVFEVTGIYIHDKRYFAMDFARPHEDTFITFAHEMVHAADPKLDTYRATYKNDYDQVVRILVRWLEGSPDLERNLPDILDHIFFETGLDQFRETAVAVREQRQTQLKETIRALVAEQMRKAKEEQQREYEKALAIAKAEAEKAAKELPKDGFKVVVPPVEMPKLKFFEPTQNELEFVRHWMNAVIGLTVENEYRAYGYSMLLHGVLKSQFQILPQSKEKQIFIEKILRGDDFLATNLSLHMNPFLRVRTQVLRGAVNEAQAFQDRFQFLKITSVLDYLELFYLEETNSFISALNNNLAKQLRSINLDKLSEKNILPTWAQAGGWDLASNPVQVLSARITTAQVYRFRQNIHIIVDELKRLSEPLATLRFGILDLHDVSLGERKLLGINYENISFSTDPEDLDSKLKADLTSVPTELTNYFSLVRWNLDAAIRGDSIEGKTVASNLLRLRILKSFAWMEQSFPPFKNTLLGVKSFLQRLRDGIYSVEDLSPERVKELEAELVSAWQQSSTSQDELIKMRVLLAELAGLFTLSSEEKLVPVTQKFQEDFENMNRVLQLMGVQGTRSASEISGVIQGEATVLRQQLLPYRDRCEKASKNDINGFGGVWLERGPFRLGEQSFPLTIVCNNSLLYLLRQPGENLRFLTTTTAASGYPESRLFFNSRAIRLYPVNLEEKRSLW